MPRAKASATRGLGRLIEHLGGHLGLEHLGPLAAFTVALAACGGGAGPGARTAPASNPEGSISASRTIDNAGWVDAAGRTSSETSRTEMSGMRATELGSESITGTPGKGFSVDTARAVIGEGPSASAKTSGGGAPPVDVIGRVLSAYCDRENLCGHIGAGRAWSTAEACQMDTRKPLVERIDALQCKGIGNDALALCLTALRNRACDDPRRAQDLPSCIPDDLCS